MGNRETHGNEDEESKFVVVVVYPCLFVCLFVRVIQKSSKQYECIHRSEVTTIARWDHVLFQMSNTCDINKCILNNSQPWIQHLSV